MRVNFLRLLMAVVFLPYAAMAQDKTDTDEKNIIAVAEDACECTREISVSLHKDTIVSKINSCITSAILADQMKVALGSIDEILENAVEAGDTTQVASKKKEKNIIIYADENFDEIQAYMRSNCQAVKTLMGSDNMQLKYSMSKNKKALKFYEEGQAYDIRQQYDLALVSYNKAVKADPKFAFAWDNLGIAYRKLGNYKEAINCYKKSLALDPNGRVPLMNSAVAYMLLEDYRLASETYVAFINQHPTDPEGYFGAGKSFYLEEDYAKGVDYMLKAYLMYADAKSPYFNDAQQLVSIYYNDLKEKGKLDIFMEAAKNNNVQINE